MTDQAGNLGGACKAERVAHRLPGQAGPAPCTEINEDLAAALLAAALDLGAPRLQSGMEAARAMLYAFIYVQLSS